MAPRDPTTDAEPDFEGGEWSAVREAYQRHGEISIEVTRKPAVNFSTVTDLTRKLADSSAPTPYRLLLPRTCAPAPHLPHTVPPSAYFATKLNVRAPAPVHHLNYHIAVFPVLAVVGASTPGDPYTKQEETLDRQRSRQSDKSTSGGEINPHVVPPRNLEQLTSCPGPYI